MPYHDEENFGFYNALNRLSPSAPKRPGPGPGRSALGAVNPYEGYGKWMQGRAKGGPSFSRSRLGKILMAPSAPQQFTVPTGLYMKSPENPGGIDLLPWTDAAVDDTGQFWITQEKHDQMQGGAWSRLVGLSNYFSPARFGIGGLRPPGKFPKLVRPSRPRPDYDPPPYPNVVIGKGTKIRRIAHDDPSRRTYPLMKIRPLPGGGPTMVGPDRGWTVDEIWDPEKMIGYDDILLEAGVESQGLGPRMGGFVTHSRKGEVETFAVSTKARARSHHQDPQAIAIHETTHVMTRALQDQDPGQFVEMLRDAVQKVLDHDILLMPELFQELKDSRLVRIVDGELHSNITSKTRFDIEADFAGDFARLANEILAEVVTDERIQAIDRWKMARGRYKQRFHPMK